MRRAAPAFLLLLAVVAAGCGRTYSPEDVRHALARDGIASAVIRPPATRLPPRNEGFPSFEAAVEELSFDPPFAVVPRALVLPVGAGGGLRRFTGAVSVYGSAHDAWLAQEAVDIARRHRAELEQQALRVMPSLGAQARRFLVPEHVLRRGNVVVVYDGASSAVADAVARLP